MPHAVDTAVNTALIHEIFSGIQGEGVLVGFRQIFTRFHGCNLTCVFCDTPASRGGAPSTCALETRAGSRELVALPNPLTVTQLMAAIMQYQGEYPHHSVSLTGGEPLLWCDFLDELLPQLHETGIRSFLETNGTLHEEMAALSTPPHFVAMDIKLPSATGITPQWEWHARFLDVTVRRLSRTDGGYALPDRLQVKLVFAEESLSDIEYAAEMVAHYRPDIPCILQPVTPLAQGPTAPTGETLLEAQRLASSHLFDVRVIPQTHVMLGQW